MKLFIIFTWLFGATCLAFWLGPELKERREEQEERARQQRLHDEQQAIKAGNGIHLQN